MELTLTHSLLRPWRADDLDALVKHAGNRKVAENLRDRFPHPYTRDAGRLWLEEAVRVPQNLWCIEVSGAAGGGIGVFPKEREERNTAEIGYWLAEPFWNRGIMTEAVGAITDYAFRTFAIGRIEAGVFEGNLASARVLERNGYQLEGRMKQRIIKFGVVRDQLMYAKLRSGPA